MKNIVLRNLALLCLLLTVACQGGKIEQTLASLEQMSANVKKEYAPDRRGEVYETQFSVAEDQKTWILKGATTVATAKDALLAAAALQNIDVKDSMKVLPDAALEGKVYGVAALSVINFRYDADYDSESATQVVMGTPLKILDKKGGWTRAVTPEGYIAYTTSKSISYMDEAAFNNWIAAPKVIINSYYTLFRNKPFPKSDVVSDGVMGNIVEYLGDAMAYYKVRLPRGEEAYVSKFDAEPFGKWVADSELSVDNIIETAHKFVGFPYLWAGTSIKAMDCSGFVKTVMYMNGVITLRDASQMAYTGENVDLGPEGGYKNLQRGDIIFFGRKATAERKELATHVGIYLGDAKFIHSATYVRINSLEPKDADYYEGSPRLIRAARFQNAVDKGMGLVSMQKHPWYFIQ